MKTSAAIIGLLAFAAITPASAAPVVGETTPAFSETTIDGVSLTNDMLDDQLYILEWTNHECPFVQKHYNAGNMQKTQQKAAEADAVWITVISSAPGKQGHVSADEARELTTSRGAQPDHIILDEDGSMGRLFDAKTTPHMYISDRTDTLRYAGAIDSIRSASVDDIPQAENYVLSAVTSISAGQEVATKQTRPYGCAVKY